MPPKGADRFFLSDPPHPPTAGQLQRRWMCGGQGWVPSCSWRTLFLETDPVPGGVSLGLTPGRTDERGLRRGGEAASRRVWRRDGAGWAGGRSSPALAL